MGRHAVWIGAVWGLFVYALYCALHATLPGLGRRVRVLEVVAGVVIAGTFGAMLGLLLTR
jgi:uncharacterized membrane protein